MRIFRHKDDILLSGGVFNSENHTARRLARHSKMGGAKTVSQLCEDIELIGSEVRCASGCAIS